MVKERLVVIGGDAAGMSAASQVRRQRPDWEIIVFERSPHTSYAA
jgi:NADPH-dependent 2,4-dienoyl-CoA reductase/sulfur reductase-like enzyme